jgi:pyruvate ferredoxin oxidoreductase alpha subunit
VLKQIEGSRAVAEAVAMWRPQVICAYPITPQTRIIEAEVARMSAARPSGPSAENILRERAEIALSGKE